MREHAAARRSCAKPTIAPRWSASTFMRSRRSRPADDAAERPCRADRRDDSAHAGRHAADAAGRSGCRARRLDSLHRRSRTTCAFTSKRWPTDAPAVLDLVRTALVAPDFSPATVRDARAALVAQIALIAADGACRSASTCSTQPRRRRPMPGCRELRNAGLARAARAGRRRVPSIARTIVAAARSSARPGVSSALDAERARRRSPTALPAGNTSAVAVHVAPLHGSSREIVDASRHRFAVADRAISRRPASTARISVRCSCWRRS